MSGDTMQLLIKALTEELDEMARKPEVRIADDKPIRIGEWCRREEARQVFGIPAHRLKQFVIEGKVIAKKFDPDDPQSAVVFKTAEIRKAIKEMPNYIYPTKNRKDKDDDDE